MDLKVTKLDSCFHGPETRWCGPEFTAVAVGMRETDSRCVEKVFGSTRQDLVMNWMRTGVKEQEGEEWLPGAWLGGITMYPTESERTGRVAGIEFQTRANLYANGSPVFISSLKCSSKFQIHIFNCSLGISPSSQHAKTKFTILKKKKKSPYSGKLPSVTRVRSLRAAC